MRARRAGFYPAGGLRATARDSVRPTHRYEESGVPSMSTGQTGASSRSTTDRNEREEAGRIEDHAGHRDGGRRRETSGR